MDEISLIEYLNTLKDRKSTVIAVTVIVIMITVLILAVMPRTFEAETALLFPQQSTDSLGSQLAQITGLPMLGGVSSLSGREVYISVLKSRTISENVLKRVGLDKYGLTSGDLKDRLLMETPKEGGLIITCQVPTSWLKGRVPQGQLRGRTAELAARIANTYIDELAAYDRSNSLFMSRKNRLFIERQLGIAKVKLGQAEDELEGFQKKHPTLIPPDQASAYAEQAQEIVAKQIEADVAVRETEGQHARAEAIWKAGAPGDISPEAVANNSAIDALRTQLVALEVKRAILLENFTDKHPDVVSLSQEIDKTHEKLRSETARVISGQAGSVSLAHQELLKQLVVLEVAKDGITARRNALSDSWNAVERRLADLPAQEMNYVRLLRDLKAAETVYTTLLAEHAKARVAEGRERDSFIVLDDARAPEKPAKPKVKLTLMVAMMMGIMLGVMVAILQGPAPVKKRKLSSSM